MGTETRDPARRLSPTEPQDSMHAPLVSLGVDTIVLTVSTGPHRQTSLRFRFHGREEARRGRDSLGSQRVRFMP